MAWVTFFIFLSINARFFAVAQASQWWPLLHQLGASSLSSGGHRAVDMICNSIPGLVARQRKMCKNYPRVMIALGEGAKLGMFECRYQFKFERWNCSDGEHSSENGLTSVMKKSTRETAFLYAVSSAGVVYTITRACSEGDLDTCHCDPSKQGQSRDLHGTFQWGGCSDNIRYALRFARSFMDAKDKQMKQRNRPDTRALMNLHNSRAGRRVVWKTKRLLCKCHGVSGACSLRTCWQTLHMFRKVGKIIKKKYERAMKIVMSQHQNGLIVANGRREPPPKSVLVFFEDSPDYCRVDSQTGSRGTAGRVCNATSTGEDACWKLCCGRGYDTFETTVTRECHCKFYWCCSVKCKTCQEQVLIHRCKSLVDDVRT